MSPTRKAGRTVPAIKVRQWLPAWEEVPFDPKRFRGRPPEHFFLFSLAASDLKALSGIFRRTTRGGAARSDDLGIQRRHDESRSREIREYVDHGFPWSSLSPQRRASGEFDDLKKPGWLPTAIVVNILRPGDRREARAMLASDAVTVQDESAESAAIKLPTGFTGPAWRPTAVAPIEIIDGQHRLWAFEDARTADDFQLPIVAFCGLDISWQAYLFYTINIKPKKINTSLAFDLYPLLRTEDWLERFEGHSIYRETRAQEITEVMWSHPLSPWHDRIDMLGERGRQHVTQAAWIRSLTATFVKSFEGRGVKIGGLFGAPVGGHQLALGWSRAQQAGFVIALWQALADSIAVTRADWAAELRDAEPHFALDAALAGKFTLLNSDQGVRGVLALFNDLCYADATRLELHRWEADLVGEDLESDAVSEAIESLASEPVAAFLRKIAESLASYDWRTSGAPGLSDAEKSSKARFRGGTGYRELRRDLLYHVAASGGQTGDLATDVATYLGY